MGYFQKPETFRIILMERETHGILSLKDLSLGYRSGRNERNLLLPLNASARPGELIAVIGRNGIGKSTLLRTLAGLQPSLGGEVVYGSRSLRNYSRKDLARTIGYISTEIVKVSNMRVYDLVALGRFPHTNWIGRIDPSDHEAIINALEKTGMSGFAGRFISELSDGERQKTMIARILAQDTVIMVMDEPTAFLDIPSRFEILRLMHLLSKNKEKTIIFSTHDLNVAMSQSDKIWLMHGDKITEGAPEDLSLAGAFDHLFDSSAVRYNPENGTYSFTGTDRGEVNVSGEGIMFHYTKKALNRAGFSVVESSIVPCLKVPAGNNSKWEFVGSNSTEEYDNLYEMLGRIENKLSGSA
jgi:iron complex transport system ATP-binding protein